MTQPPKDGQPGYDVATVVLNADAAKVYATAVGLLHRNQTVHVVSEDAAHRSVEFSSGVRSAGITVTALGTGLSQMVVASAVMPGQESATLRIVDGILRVCQEMKVACSAH
jgi:tetrahydromethanopterin S-methyltransferase subunit D